jgi:hypothetical protein
MPELPRRLRRLRRCLRRAGTLVLIGWGGLFHASLHAQQAAERSVTAGDEAAEPELFGRTAPVETGDRCIVCGALLRAEDKVFLVGGQRVGVTKAMEPALRSEPWVYLGRLRPRGGLFGGETAPNRYAPYAWLWLGIYFTSGLAFAAACGHRALNTGQPALPWFFAGLFLNAFGYFGLLLQPRRREAVFRARGGLAKIPATAEPRTCAACGAMNHPSAVSCIRCGGALSPDVSSEVDRLG